MCRLKNDTWTVIWFILTPLKFSNIPPAHLNADEIVWDNRAIIMQKIDLILLFLFYFFIRSEFVSVLMGMWTLLIRLSKQTPDWVSVVNLKNKLWGYKTFILLHFLTVFNNHNQMLCMSTDNLFGRKKIFYRSKKW